VAERAGAASRWRWRGTSAALRLQCQRSRAAREAAFRIEQRAPAPSVNLTFAVRATFQPKSGVAAP